MTEINEEYSKTYKPGIYFIGDTCYALKKHPYWDWVCEDPGSFNAYDEFAIAPTMYGDGVYRDIYSGKEFSVDSASLGLVNMKYSEPNENVTLRLDELGAIVEVNDYLKFAYDPDEYSFYYEIDGQVVQINTADEDE